MSGIEQKNLNLDEVFANDQNYNMLSKGGKNGCFLYEVWGKPTAYRGCYYPKWERTP